MRRTTLAILAACAAVTICGQAQAQQPAAAPAAPAAVPDQMPFDIPYGNSITADRAANVVKAIVAKPRNLPATGSSPFPSSIRTVTSSISTRWTTRSLDRCRSRRTRRAPRRAFAARRRTSTTRCRPPPAPISPRSIHLRRRIARRYPACRGGKSSARSAAAARTGDQDAVACKAGADTVK